MTISDTLDLYALTWIMVLTGSLSYGIGYICLNLLDLFDIFNFKVISIPYVQRDRNPRNHLPLQPLKASNMLFNSNLFASSSIWKVTPISHSLLGKTSSQVRPIHQKSQEWIHPLSIICSLHSILHNQSERVYTNVYRHWYHYSSNPRISHTTSRTIHPTLNLLLIIQRHYSYMHGMFHPYLSFIGRLFLNFTPIPTPPIHRLSFLCYSVWVGRYLSRELRAVAGCHSISTIRILIIHSFLSVIIRPLPPTSNYPPPPPYHLFPPPNSPFPRSLPPSI